MITVEAAAKILGLMPVTVSMLCRRGQIEGAVKFGHVWTIPDRPIYTNRRSPGRPRTERDDVEAAAKILGLTPSTVRLLCGRGAIEGAVKIGSAWTIPDPPIYINRRLPGRPPIKRDDE